MESAILAKELLEAIGSINRKDVISKLDISIKGEELFLLMLSEMGGVGTPTGFTQEASFTPARLSAIIKSLENKGYISKKTDETDKRCSIIEITQSGESRAKERKDEIFLRSFSIIDKLGEEDAATFVRLVKRLIDIVSEKEEGKGSELK